MAELLGALTSAGVRSLTSSPPTLEELFLEAYRPDPSQHPAGVT
jgi:ABC-2 type transport system ATP-binding protein